MALSREELRQLALAGARTRLQQLEAERRTLLQEFPELRSTSSRSAPSPRPSTSSPRKRNFSAAQRRAISRRMKALWAERRKTKAKAA